MKIASLVLALVIAPFVHAADDCARTPLHDFIERGQDLYLGELHGTVELPALVRCLTLAAVARGKETVIVSLEQQPIARELDSAEWWRKGDGRASGAMWGLMRFLLEQEQAGKLVLDQQIAFPVLVSVDGKPPKIDPAGYERNMGTHLRELAGRGQVIALSGNAHSRKERMPALDFDPAGKYVGESFVHVDVEARNGGTAWNCGPDGECGINRLRPSMLAGDAGALVDGKPIAHDYIYFVPRFTASPPQYQ